MYCINDKLNYISLACEKDFGVKQKVIVGELRCVR